jgi:DNA-binding response OmpR family regulator
LTLDTAHHSVARGGQPIDLTTKEYALLEFLVLNKDWVVSRQRIGQYLWDEHFDAGSDLIDIYIRRLGSKLDTDSDRRLIHNCRGEGYTISANGLVADGAAFSHRRMSLKGRGEGESAWAPFWVWF